MSQEHFYEVDIQWKQDRVGELSSSILNKSIECATPPEFPNGVPGIWSPEHLFVASINSCFMATFLAISHNFKMEVASFDCKTTARLEMVDGRYLITQATMNPVVKLVNPDTDREKAFRVLEKAKSGCLVTNSMKTEVSMEPSVN